MMKKIMLSKASLGRTLLIFCLSLRICYCFHFKETKKFWKFLLMFSINGVPSGILLLKFSPLSEPMQCNCVSMKHKIKLCSSKKLDAQCYFSGMQFQCNNTVGDFILFTYCFRQYVNTAQILLHCKGPKFPSNVLFPEADQNFNPNLLVSLIQCKWFYFTLILWCSFRFSFPIGVRSQLQSVSLLALAAVRTLSHFLSSK